MVRMLVMQPMAIHPGDRTYIEPEDVVHDSDDFYEPFLVVERTMSDTQMKNVGQIQPAKEPAKDKINSADQRASPRSQMSWGEIHTTQHVGKNDQIAGEIVDFHDGSPSGIQAEIGALSNNKVDHSGRAVASGCGDCSQNPA